MGREFRKYEKSRGVLPNIQADFLKTFLDQKTSLSAQLKHDYAEKEWSNVCEEQMVAASTLAYAFSPNFTLKSTGMSTLKTTVIIFLINLFSFKPISKYFGIVIT